MVIEPARNYKATSAVDRVNDPNTAKLIVLHAVAGIQFRECRKS